MLWNTVELTLDGPQCLRSARSFGVGTAITCSTTPGSCSSLCSLAMFFWIVFCSLCSSLFFLRNPKPFTGFRMLMTSHDRHDHGLVHYDQNSRLCHSALPGTAPWQAAQKQRLPTSNAFKVQCSLQTCEKTSSQTALAEVSTFCTLQVYNSDRLDLFGSIW